MSDFWSRKIAPQPQAPAAPPQSTQPWWAPRAPAPSQVTPVGPVVVQQPQQVPYGSTTQPPAGQAHIEELWQQNEYQTTKAKSNTTDNLGPCPECGSPNYTKAAGLPNSMPQCFNCGHNPRFTQMGSGDSTGGIKSNESSYPARQQHLAQSNFNPKVVDPTQGGAGRVVI